MTVSGPEAPGIRIDPSICSCSPVLPRFVHIDLYVNGYSVVKVKLHVWVAVTRVYQWFINIVIINIIGR